MKPFICTIVFGFSYIHIHVHVKSLVTVRVVTRMLYYLTIIDTRKFCNTLCVLHVYYCHVNRRNMFAKVFEQLHCVFTGVITDLP